MRIKNLKQGYYLLICRLLGHIYILKPKPDILSNKRECKRCGHRQIRMQKKFPEFYWIDDPVEKFINTKIP
jgi:hypothetical protein